MNNHDFVVAQNHAHHWIFERKVSLSLSVPTKKIIYADSLQKVKIEPGV